jgi:5-methylcytosine-specific restriction protein A
VLSEQPLCRACLDRGVYEPARHVDHIRPHKGVESLRLSKANCQPLCVGCHTAKTDQENQR